MEKIIRDFFHENSQNKDLTCCNNEDGITLTFEGAIVLANKILRECKDHQICEGCTKHFEIETMFCDHDANWFCKTCWVEIETEYKEMLEKGEIEE